MTERLKALWESPWLRLVLVIAGIAAVVAAFWWRGPEWHAVGDAFRAVQWEWVAVAIGLNLLSVVARAVAWRTVIGQAMPPPHPRFGLVFSAFSVGLMANAVLPGRVGELARVAVLRRHMPPRKGVWATLVGSVFAHRVFDLIPMVMLVVAVLTTADLPHWALTSLVIFLAAGAAVFVFAWLSARHHHRTRLDGLGSFRRLVTMARHGLGVMRRPLPAAIAIFFQCIGWLCQLFAVWAAMHAFDIQLDLAAAALVLVLMNVATILPLWPGNVGLVQAAVALPLVRYGVPYAKGFAFGIGLQVIEASVGVGFGLIFLGREGLSFAALRRMPGAVEADTPEEPEAESAAEVERPRARVSG
jgi:glycosyltransferase 2 family protein